MLGVAPLETQYLYLSISISLFCVFSLFSYQPSVSIGFPSRLYLFSVTTTRYLASPRFPIFDNLITTDIKVLYHLLSFLSSAFLAASDSAICFDFPIPTPASVPFM